MKIPRWIINSLLITLLTGVLIACNVVNDQHEISPVVEDGVIDLREWDFQHDGSVKLNGEWIFVDNQFVPPGSAIFSETIDYFPVPLPWSEYDIPGKLDNPEGMGTFSVKILLPESPAVYGFFTEGFGTAYTLFVDGKLLYQQGQVGSNSQEMQPEMLPVSIFFCPSDESIELTIHVSNFHHRNGGFINALVLGLDKDIRKQNLIGWSIDTFSFGVLSIMGMYHGFRFLYHKKNRAARWFAFLCALAAIRIGVTNHCTFPYFFPAITWEIAIRIEYLTFFLALPIFTLYLRSLFPEDVKEWFAVVSIVLAVFYSAFALFAPTLQLSNMLFQYQVICLAEIGYFLYFLVRITVKKRESFVGIDIATLIVFAAMVFEMATINFHLPAGQISAYCFLVFIFVQSILLSSRFSKTFSMMENLSNDLKTANDSLVLSEQKFRKIFEDSKDVIFLTDFDFYIEDVSPACETILGYSEDEMVHRRITDFMENPNEFERYFDTLFEKDTLDSLVIEMLCYDEKTIIASLSVSLRVDDRGTVIGYQGTIRDITAQQQIEEERLLSTQLKQIAITDPLTQIYNRRFFYEVAQKELARDKRSESGLSLIIFDIDHFKKVNDTFGHLVGDEVLINLAKLCQENIRSMDVIARFGGEEFVILLPDTDDHEAYELAERLRMVISTIPFASSFNGKDIKITVSLGVVNWNSSMEDIKIDDLLNRADQALYQAKDAGRNRTMIWNK